MAKLHNFAHRAPLVHVALAAALAAGAYLVLFLFPVLTLGLLVQTATDALTAETNSDWLAVAVLATLCALSAWASVDIWRTRTRGPAGQPLSRARHPDLWARIDQLCADYAAPAVDEVLLTNRFELDLEHRPVRGLPLSHRNTLTLGLPLAMSVAPEHLGVLLARRISMLPRRGNWPLAWLVQLRLGWHRYAQAFDGWGPGRSPMGLFFDWYAPLYSRFTVALARRAEFTADRNAQRLHDDWTVEEAITLAVIRKAFVENKLWPALLRMSVKYAEPPLLPFSNLEELLEKELDADRAHRLLDGLLAAKAADDTFMPTLRQRWTALSGNRPRLPTAPATSAAARLLHATLEPAQAHFDKLWLKTNLQRWHDQHSRSRNDQRRLEELLRQVPEELLSKDEIWECTVLVRQYMGQEKALELYKALLATQPSDPRVYFSIGSFLLSCRDAQGVPALETAMRMDQRYTPDACELISEFMSFTGERRQARSYRKRATHYSDDEAAA